jgi:hypothetical protein
MPPHIRCIYYKSTSHNSRSCSGSKSNRPLTVLPARLVLLIWAPRYELSKSDYLLSLRPLDRTGPESYQSVRSERSSYSRLIHGTSDGHHILIYTRPDGNVITQYPVLSLHHITNSYIRFREEEYLNFAVINELGLK